MTNWRKGSALLLVGMMIMSGLVALSAPVFADESTTISLGSGETYNIAFVDTYMISTPGVAGADEQIVFNTNPAGNRLIYLGENELQLSFGLSVTNDPGEDVTIAVQGTGVVSVGDDTGGQVATGGWGAVVIDFTIDTANIGDVEQIYPLTIRITEDTNGNSGTIGIGVYVSSLWHSDNTDDLIDTEYTLPDVVDVSPTAGSGTDVGFEAGDTFKAARLTLNNDAPFAVEELNGTLTSNDAQITLYNNVARTPAGVAVDANGIFNYRVDVDARTPPGDTYEAEFVCEYMRDDGGIVRYITENMRMSYFAVDFSFADDDPMDDGLLWSEYQCYATDVVILNDTRQVDYVAPYDIPTIDQSLYTDEPLMLEVTIVNNGNTPLNNVEFELDPTAPGDWDYFRNPRFFWDNINAGTPTYDTISDTYTTFGIGDTITFQIEVFVMNDIPIGEHRLPIIYNGFYFNDGSLGDPTSYATTFTDLEVIFSVFVVDDTIACHISGVDTTITDELGDKEDLTAETVEVTVVNDEQYNFIDIIVNADFTGTPWYMPVIGMADPWVAANEANIAQPTDTWDAAGDLVVTFDVDTYPDMTPDRYPFVLEITAVIEETLEVVTVYVDYTQGAVIDYEGFGPDIYITAFTGDEEIVPGEDFSLTLTLTNQGDDTLRNVVIAIGADDTEVYDSWDFEVAFKDQFDWSKVFADWGSGDVGTVTWEDSEFPSEMFYTMESLDVDNIREIVEINLYADGVYSDPGARIVAIRILDMAPGATTDVIFDMYADKDLVNGKPYAFDVSISGVDSEGNDYNVPRTISVMSSLPGTSYNPVELDWFDAGIKALGLFLFFVIVLAILLFVYNMFKGDPYDEDEEDFDFEEDEEPGFEPAPEPAAVEAPEPPAAEEELVEP